jgi:hypothetical protein
MDRSHLRQMFKVDGADWVKLEDLRNGLRNLQIHLSDERFDRVVDLVDTNDNGRIEFIEFEDLVFGSAHPGAEHVSEEKRIRRAVSVIMKSAGKAVGRGKNVL